jgi:hypothetical protein
VNYFQAAKPSNPPDLAARHYRYIRVTRRHRAAWRCGSCLTLISLLPMNTPKFGDVVDAQFSVNERQDADAVISS